MPFEVIYSEEATEELSRLRAFDRRQMQQVNDPRTPISEVLKAADAGGVLLESGSKVRYAVLPLDDELLDFLLEHNPRFIAECQEIRSRMRNGRYRTHEEVRRLLGRPRGRKAK